MLPSSPNSPGVKPNPALGSPLPYKPSDPLSITLRTSGKAPTSLLTGLLSSVCAISTTTSFLHPKNTTTLTLSDHPLTTPSAWQTINKLLHHKSSSPLPSPTPLPSPISLADSFASFFTDKISYLRLSLSSNPTTPSPHSPSSHTTPTNFYSFTPASEYEILKILPNCPNKQSDSDAIPTWLLKECASALVTTITNFVNFSLTSGQFHPILKESVISPQDQATA